MTAPRTARRAGTTLVELMVVLAILAMVTGLAAVAFTMPASSTPTAADRVAAARRRAIATGRVVPVTFDSVTTDSQRAVALPDGSVLGGDAARVDRLSGRPIDATR